MKKIAEAIVACRYALFALFAAAVIFSVLHIGSTRINYDVTKYLPEDSETKQALEIMDQEFVTYGSALVMVRNVDVETAKQLGAQMAKIPGVRAVAFDGDASDYISKNALYEITMEEKDTAESSKQAVYAIEELLASYDAAFGGEVVRGISLTKGLSDEINLILGLSVLVIILILLLTSHSYIEVPICLLVLGVSCVIHMGTNYLLGEISSITNSIAVILQLALGIDYSIILLHAFIKEKEACDKRTAMVAALQRSIPAILASSLTTVAGLVAIMFMNFRLGFDIGIVLTKGVIITMVTVFLLMPGILYFCAGLLEKTRHKVLISKGKTIGRFSVRARRVLSAAFVVLMITGAFLSAYLHFIYYEGTYPSGKRTAYVADTEAIEEVFGARNRLAVVLPKGDFAKEKAVTALLEEQRLIDGVTGLAATGLFDPLTAEEAAARFSIDPPLAEAAFAYYKLMISPELTAISVYDYFQAVYDDFNEKNYTSAQVVETAAALLRKIDPAQLDPEAAELVGALKRQIDGKSAEEILAMESELLAPLRAKYPALAVFSLRNSAFQIKAILNLVQTKLSAAVAQLQGARYTRIVCNLQSGVETEETFALIQTLRQEIKPYYPESYLAGNSVSFYDISLTFDRDVTLISVVTILFISVILMLTFRSIGIPILLVLIIQGAIWINFGLEYVKGNPVLFISYIVITAIQMGATIDYAILMTSKYLEDRRSLLPAEAAKSAFYQAYPTILTSGGIMSIAGLFVGLIASNAYVFTIGRLLAQGTVISMAAVLLVLPGLLILFDRPLALLSLNGWRERRLKKENSVNRERKAEK